MMGVLWRRFHRLHNTPGSNFRIGTKSKQGIGHTMSDKPSTPPQPILALAGDAEQLEQIYHAAHAAGETDACKQAIDDSYTNAPENLLYAAWFHRLKYAAAQAKGYAVAWAWVIPLAIANALLFWWLSDDRFVLPS